LNFESILDSDLQWKNHGVFLGIYTCPDQVSETSLTSFKPFLKLYISWEASKAAQRPFIKARKVLDGLGKLLEGLIGKPLGAGNSSLQISNFWGSDCCDI